MFHQSVNINVISRFTSQIVFMNFCFVNMVKNFPEWRRVKTKYEHIHADGLPNVNRQYDVTFRRQYILQLKD